MQCASMRKTVLIAARSDFLTGGGIQFCSEDESCLLHGMKEENGAIQGI
jgi:hypothetical protein